MPRPRSSSTTRWIRAASASRSSPSVGSTVMQLTLAMRARCGVVAPTTPTRSSPTVTTALPARLPGASGAVSPSPTTSGRRASWSVRRRLAARYGNAAPGYVPPSAISGAMSARPFPDTPGSGSFATSAAAKNRGPRTELSPELRTMVWSGNSVRNPSSSAEKASTLSSAPTAPSISEACSNWSVKAGGGSCACSLALVASGCSRGAVAVGGGEADGACVGVADGASSVVQARRTSRAAAAAARSIERLRITRPGAPKFGSPSTASRRTARRCDKIALAW